MNSFKNQKEIQRNDFGDIGKGCFCSEERAYFFRKNKIEKKTKRNKKVKVVQR